MKIKIIKSGCSQILAHNAVLLLYKLLGNCISGFFRFVFEENNGVHLLTLSSEPNEIICDVLSSGYNAHTKKISE